MLDGSGTSTAGIFPLIMVIPIAEIIVPMQIAAQHHEELWKYIHAYGQELDLC